MQAGSLRHRVVIQGQTQTRDGAGGVERTWATVTTRWASIQPLSPREMFAAGQVLSEVTHKITMRYCTDVTAQSRIVFGSRTFEVSGPPMHDDERQRMTTVLAIERTMT